jgi:hypothetical protein
VDATKFRTYRPQRQQEQDYSGHIAAHCRQAQAITSSDGTILAFDSGFHGRQHDSTTYAQSEVGSRPLVHLGPNETLVGDKAYIGIAEVLAPFRRPQLLGRPDRQLYNRVLNRGRAAVERGFAFLKGKWACTNRRWRHPSRALLALSSHVAALLSNRIRRVEAH